jgi:hypothetical protein
MELQLRGAKSFTFARHLVFALLVASASGNWRRHRDCIRDDLTCAPWSAAKRREIELATQAEARERERLQKAGQSSLPLRPTHTTVCDGRPCRPGEGNLKHARNKRGVFEMWQQPYEHREAEVQSKGRRPPHPPDPATHYAGLVAEARRVASGKLVILTSADWDYRELALNWVLHAHRLGYRNAMVLSMDTELHADLVRRRIPSFDDSANLARWNGTVLQRHIQAVRMERWLAVSALISSGLDVLSTDATAVFVRDFVPRLVAEPADVDILMQRDNWPVEPLHRMGTAANAGFNYLRATRGTAVARFLADAVTRGMIEFYLRWNNIVDGGHSALVRLGDADLGRRAPFLRSTSTAGPLCSPSRLCGRRRASLPTRRPTPRSSGGAACARASAASESASCRTTASHATAAGPTWRPRPTSTT